MRVLLWTDMEGISQVIDHRQCWPVFPHYWHSGRRTFTADVAAAATGLFDGGATAVGIINGHGLGWPNLLVEHLPDRAELLSDVPPDAFDALFQVGFHARCGTPDGFVSHTFVPNFRIAVDGALATESHVIAWNVGLPLLGITGDAVLQAQLNGTLAGTPFLGVKHSSSRSVTIPRHPDADESVKAIREFADQCVRQWRQQSAPTLPSPFMVSVSMAPDLADRVVGPYGLTRESPSVLAVAAEDWNRDARSGVWVAMGAALSPLLEAQGALDLSSEAAMAYQEPLQLERCRRHISDWVHDDPPAWQV